ncbi:IS66 family insertion sequence element accessory protein TnpB [Ligilactobacillus acidipiscis]|uniref:IS66 family insertion sequence element accessory protein TnpB n=1 Tax=Ligilactobacillus acidipiscis TaxID=89059 RepID=UPI003D7A7E26
MFPHDVRFRKSDQIYLATGKPDFRKETDGLTAVVTEKFDLAPFSKDLVSILWQLWPNQLKRLLQGWAIDATIHNYDLTLIQQTK